MCLNPLTIKQNGVIKTVPCGKCVECLQKYSNDWALRCMLEAKKYKNNAFITLTYNDANLPEGASLRKRDFQNFMKRLRKQLARSDILIRFFACGEYGSHTGRPHYHAIIFGFNFDDKYFFSTDNKGNKLYRSPLLEKCWIFGFSSVGELSFDTAKYCAKYMQVDYRLLGKKEPQFTLMSRRPGLALDCIPKTVFRDGYLYYEGKRIYAPKAFLRVVKNEFPAIYDIIKYKRLSFSERLRVKYTDEFGIWQDESLLQLFLYNKEQEERERRENLEKRRERIKKIFGKGIDKAFKPVLLLNRFLKTIRKQS